MAKPIHSIVTDPEELLALNPERLAGVILEHLNSGDARERESISLHNFGLPYTVQGYSSQYRENILKVLMEGWNWLEQNGFLVPKPGSQGWYNISRKGEGIKKASDIEAFLSGGAKSNSGNAKPQGAADISGENNSTPSVRLPIRYWILLTNPHISEVVEIMEGREFTYRIAPNDSIKPGDIAYLWRGYDEDLYGWGEIGDTPIKKEMNQDLGKERYLVPVIVRAIFGQTLTRREIQGVPILANLVPKDYPELAAIVVQPPEVRAINQIIRARGFQTPVDPLAPSKSEAQDQSAYRDVEAQEISAARYNDDLDSLRTGVTNDQHAVLNAIWRYYLEKKRGIPMVALYRQYGELTVRQALGQLGNKIIIEEKAHDSDMKLCRLTFLGGLLTDQGEEGEQLLARYLEYVRELFATDYENKEIKSKDIEAQLGLTETQSRTLGNFLFLSPFSNGGSFGDEEWQANLPIEMDDLFAHPDLRAYVRRRALAGVASVSSLSKEAKSQDLPSQEGEEELLEGAAEASILTSSISDQPSEKDALGFNPYVEAIAEFLTSPATKPPLTLSIEGKWGSGKSSFMLQLEKLLADRGKIAVKFNPWRHDREDALWAAFALEFMRKLSQRLSLFERLVAGAKLAWLRFNWKDGWFDAARVAIISLAFLITTIAFFFLSWSKGIEWLASWATAKQEDKDLLQSLIKGGGVVGYLAIFVYFLNKLKAFVGNPLDIKLAQYVKSPDYKSRVAFIEQFHEDFDKIIKAYAGEEIVYVFVDDIDRCEAPKAADLMQAINLMISDAAPLIFIIGMDREKVAAALAVKHEKLLPYFAAMPVASGTPAGSSFDPAASLEYGYNFIEKFVQLPFLVPQPIKTDIQRLLSEISNSIKTDGRSALQNSVENKIESGLVEKDGDRPIHQQDSGEGYSATGAEEINRDDKIESQIEQKIEAPPSLTPQQMRRRERIKFTATEESQTIHDIVLMVAPALDHNPRRLKQFINLFRLRTFIAVNTGLFDKPGRPQDHDTLCANIP